MFKRSLSHLALLGLALAGFSPALLTTAEAQGLRQPSTAPSLSTTARPPKTAPASSDQPAAAPLDASSARYKSEDDHILVPGDLIEVKVFQEPDLDSTLRVSQDGTVTFPLIDRVKVGGITPQAASKLIRDRLDKDYLVGPHVNVRVTEYARRRFTVLGQVQKPGSYDMPDREVVSVLEAIGMSGGYTRVANPSKVTVKRTVNNKETVFKLDAKKMAADGGSNSAFEVQPGDVIMVSESVF